jgi:hypothetical protein
VCTRDRQCDSKYAANVNRQSGAARERETRAGKITKRGRAHLSAIVVAGFRHATATASSLTTPPTVPPTRSGADALGGESVAEPFPALSDESCPDAAATPTASPASTDSRLPFFDAVLAAVATEPVTDTTHHLATTHEPCVTQKQQQR